MKKSSVSCIIPYYNERERILPILNQILKSSIITELIIVDDGSTDGGIESFENPKLIKLKHELNKGKSAAMKTGFFEACGEVILFLDADLIGLKTKNVDDMLLPVLSGEYDVTISKREYLSFFDVFTGDRAMKRVDWLPFFENVKAINNGTEIRMNMFILFSQMKFKRINWDGVNQTYKVQKIGFFKGIIKDFSYVFGWMHQVGYACYSVTYLFFWIIMLNDHKSINQTFYKTYRNMFYKKFIKLNLHGKITLE